MKNYDCIIVGAGPMGIFCAYELMHQRPKARILLIDKGNDIYHRQCPILLKRWKNVPVMPTVKSVVNRLAL